MIDGLARGLTRLGHDVLLVCHPHSTCPVERVSVVPAKDAGRMGRASIELEHAVGAYEFVEHCDVVHDHTLGGTAVFDPLRQAAGGGHGAHAVRSHQRSGVRRRPAARCVGGDL